MQAMYNTRNNPFVIYTSIGLVCPLPNTSRKVLLLVSRLSRTLGLFGHLATTSPMADGPLMFFFYISCLFQGKIAYMNEF